MPQINPLSEPLTRAAPYQRARDIVKAFFRGILFLSETTGSRSPGGQPAGLTAPAAARGNGRRRSRPPPALGIGGRRRLDADRTGLVRRLPRIGVEGREGKLVGGRIVHGHEYLARLHHVADEGPRPHLAAL